MDEIMLERIGRGKLITSLSQFDEDMPLRKTTGRNRQLFKYIKRETNPITMENTDHDSHINRNKTPEKI